jgi:HrpA-like RNA helicase
MSAQRKSLPVFGYREELLRTIAANRVVVVEGETGTQKVLLERKKCGGGGVARTH